MSLSFYSSCVMCPRMCGINRESGEKGFCGETSELRVAFAGIHRGEEPPVSGPNGSGTIFISGCNLGCAFCQNYQISKGNQSSKGDQISKSVIGKTVDSGEFADICISLQEKGAANINIVTGSHSVPAIVSGIETARKRGLSIPVLWNSSGYDGINALEMLKDHIDVYLPDLKTLDCGIAARFFNASDYPEHAAAAIKKMMEYRRLRFEGNVIKSGVIIRHLVIPGFPENTRTVLKWFAENCLENIDGHKNRSKALLSVMPQYTPLNSTENKNIPSRFLSQNEYDAVVQMLEDSGIEDGFCQELVTGADWLPDFRRPNPFSSELSIPVWHWKQ